jgi:hypothetical protein
MIYKVLLGVFEMVQLLPNRKISLPPRPSPPPRPGRCRRRSPASSASPPPLAWLSYRSPCSSASSFAPTTRPRHSTHPASPHPLPPPRITPPPSRRWPCGTASTSPVPRSAATSMSNPSPSFRFSPPRSRFSPDPVSTCSSLFRCRRVRA